MFSLFVIPFCLGVLALLVISVIKYFNWYRGFDRKQQALIRKNILSWKFLPAIWEMIRESLLHWRITRHNVILGYMHRSLAFGWFLLIAVGAVQAILAFPNGHPFYVAIFFNFFEPRATEMAHFASATQFANLMDILLLYVFSGLTLAIFKKFWSKPLGMKRTTRHNLTDRVAKAALWCIFPFRLLAEGATSAIYHNGGFLVVAMGNLLRAMGLDNDIFEYNTWMFYSLALGVFFTLMPFTRYMHIFTEVFLIYFRKLGLREGDQKSGYTLYELSACSRCGICIDGCPINRELDITNIQGVYLLQTIRNKDIFNKEQDIANMCMVCGRCSTECPVGIDLATIRRQVRSQAVKPIDHPDGFQYLKRQQHFNAIGRVAYFGGCMSHLTPGITEAMEQIFQAANQNYWYMDKESTMCCGRPLLQQGLIRQADELRNLNKRLIAKSKATMLVTSCPICYQSFTQEYKLDIPVMHHTQYIDMLIKTGRIKVAKSDMRVTYHDPCELGRGCGVYDEPRRVLSSATTLLTTREEREKSLCCGYNLGNTHIETSQQQLIRDAALRNLTEPQPDRICTACPMCKKALNRANDLPVSDIAEIIAKQLILQTP
ncbi:MAG: (Fe-S)-binding protein [Bacteroidales bacterium]|nr:(Fe-S)-binding protein [Bacteroidales bacterium]MBR3413751.1 (Fe-S)-binding protein [Bacteroidales bacterium]